MAPNNQWSTEEDDFLRRCAEQGQSAGAAAALLGEIFGITRTRSAVIGRANRAGIVFRGQDEFLARQKAEAEERRQVREAQAPRPPAPRAIKAAAAELLQRRAEIKAEEERSRPTPLAPRPAEPDVVDEPAGGPGVLFLERTARQCAWWQPGWDLLPVEEKRVCGRPVTFSAGPYGAEPTSWCRHHHALVYPTAQRRQLDLKYFSRIDRNVVRMG